MSTTHRLTITLCIAAALTACAGSGDSKTDADGADSAAAVSPTPTNDTAVIHIPLTEWSVVVSQGIVAPGTFTFHAMNQGTYAHAFEIEGNGQEWKSEPIPPGGTATLTPALTAGTYEVYCPIVDANGNHKERGMRTTFTVQ